MNYKEEKHFESVALYCVSKNGVVIQSNKEPFEVIQFDDYFDILWKKNIEMYAYELNLWESILILRLSNGLIRLISDDKGQEITCKNQAGLQFYPIKNLNTNYLPFKIEKSIIDIDWQFGLYDFINDKIQWVRHNSENHGGNIINALLVSEKDGLFAVSDIKNGAPLWQKQIHTNGKIINLLAISNNQLWVITKREENYWFFFDLIAINAQTGEVEKQLNYTAFFGYTAQFIEEKQSIISLRGNFREDRGTNFLEIDARNGEIIRQQTLDQLTSIGLNVFEFTLHENYIYFTATSKEEAIFAKSIGVLSYENLELLWWEEVNLEDGAFFASGQRPVISNNRIYILDTGGTLHIFEKE